MASAFHDELASASWRSTARVVLAVILGLLVGVVLSLNTDLSTVTISAIVMTTQFLLIVVFERLARSKSRRT